MIFRGCLLLVALVVLVEGWVGEETEIEAISNPHQITSCTPSLNGLLEPYHLLTKPMITQPDSFQAMSYAKVMSVPIPIYHMKQPNRISTLELEFQLALVKDLTMAGKSLVYESPVPMERAIDSWFTGYYWTPILMSCGAAGVDAEGTSGGYQHVGWKFTSLDEQESTLPFFYALMIKRDDKKKSNGVHIGGFRAPGWMAHAIVT